MDNTLWGSLLGVLVAFAPPSLNQSLLIVFGFPLVMLVLSTGTIVPVVSVKRNFTGWTFPENGASSADANYC
jgi:hypothetical protein